MTIRNIIGMAALVLTLMAVTIVPAIAGHAGRATSATPALIPTTQTTIIVDTGIIESEDGRVAISALALSAVGD